MGAEISANLPLPPLLAGAGESFGTDGGRTAVISDQGRSPWAELLDGVNHLARQLEGEADGGPIGILLPSGRDFLTAFLAASTLGVPACTLHPDWAAPELEAAIEDAGLSLVVTEDGTVRRPTGFRTNRSSSATDDDPVFYIGFTSGTSGRPKPFLRRQKSWSSSFTPAGELFSVEAGDLVYLPGSLQHSHFLFGAVFALNRGAAIRMFGRFDAHRLAGELASERSGVLYLVPTMLIDLDRLDGEPFEGVHSVVISGSKMEAHHWAITRRLFPAATVGELYGASELSFVTVNTEGERGPGYVGRPFPGVEVEIRDADGNPTHGTGLVHVRSPYLFEGYLEGGKAVSPIGADGFVSVGDVGSLDDCGLSLSGRASNMLITGGKNVHPEEVEAMLAGHPAIRECVVAGLPHPRWGEEIVAFVVPAGTGEELEARALRSHLEGQVASYKIPKRWFLIEALPRTRAGKTDRSRDRLLEAATEI